MAGPSHAGSLVDLFSGCGGFSLGAELAGFRSLAAIDVDATLQSAYCRNFPGSRAIQASVADLGASDWVNLIGRHRPDGVIGGPPCQGFSWIGKRQKDDPRNSLLHHFYRQVSLLRPKFFVMENVEGLLSDDNADMLQSAIDTVTSRYRVLEPMIVNAADYGAATTRRRVVVVGYDPNEMDRLTPETFAPPALTRKATVRDAISDLPRPVAERKDSFGWARYPKLGTEELSEYASRLRTWAPEGLGCPEANRLHRAGRVSGLNSTKHSPEISSRYARVKGGQSDPISKSYRLEWDGQSPTLRAGTGSDKGAFQAVRPLHPGIGRVITVREAARLQGFPDWFTFHHAKWHSFRMIGNSVSPIVSYGLLSRLATRLQLALAA